MSTGFNLEHLQVKRLSRIMKRLLLWILPCKVIPVACILVVNECLCGVVEWRGLASFF